MRDLWIRKREGVCAARVVLALSLALCAGACTRRQVQVPAGPPVAPAPPDARKTAGEYFANREYDKAAQTYSAYLEANPDAPDRDAALFQLALSYSVPGSATYNRAKRRETFDQLIRLHRNSPYAAVARALLEAEKAGDEAGAQIQERDQRIRALEERATSLQQACDSQQVQLQILMEQARGSRDKDEHIRRVIAERDELQEQVRRLNAELEALKQIDLQRRPSRPPQ